MQQDAKSAYTLLLTYDPRNGRDLVVKHANLAAAILTLYAAIVLTLPNHLQRPLHAPNISRAWNGALALFAAAGAAATLPRLAALLTDHGLHHTVCADAYSLAGNGPPALFAVLFTYSKLFELGDTLLLILRRKPLTLLHVFHHASVVVFVWLAWAYVSPLALWYGTLNFGVHAIMYTYFVAVSLERRAARLAPLVTLLQLGQFVVATALNLLAAWWWWRGECAHMRGEMVAVGGVLYVCYGLLFARFFVLRYLKSPRPKERGD